MKISANSKLLNDAQVNNSEKLKLSLYIKKKSIVEADALKMIIGSSSRNEVIEKAIDFYFSYNTAQLTQDYLCGIIGAKIEGLVGSLATRISKGNFRTAVEMNMLTRLLATEVAVGKTEYDKLRVKSIHDVKQTNGSVNIMEAMNDAEEESPTE